SDPARHLVGWPPAAARATRPAGSCTVDASGGPIGPLRGHQFHQLGQDARAIGLRTDQEMYVPSQLRRYFQTPRDAPWSSRALVDHHGTEIRAETGDTTLAGRVGAPQGQRR